MCLSNKLFSMLIIMYCFNGHASELIETTDYHADEAKVVTKGNWLALQNINNEWNLVSAKPTFKKVDDAVLGPMEGINVSIEIPGHHFLLMDKSLSVGPVQSSWENQNENNVASWFETSRLPEIGKFKKIDFNKSNYELHNISGEIIIKLGKESQKLFSYSEKYETNASIKWVGDLDRDGKVDLILDASDHYNVGELGLYLSGKAEPGSLVKLVATRRTTGC
jgi:hypothetical protein